MKGWWDEEAPVIPLSTKEQIVRTSERLFARYGLEGVSLRQIGSESGCSNNSAVQYHFGSKDLLVQAIFEFRLPYLNARRRTLIAARRPDDLRSWLECYVVPILEQGEEAGSHYLGFIAMLQQHARRDLLDLVPDDFLAVTGEFRDRVSRLLPSLPDPLPAHRISQALAFCVHATAEREQARAQGYRVLPFAVHVADLMDGMIGFLMAPVSAGSVAALEGSTGEDLDWLLVP